MAHAHYSCEQLLGTGEEEADLLPASFILACLFVLLMDLVSPTDRLCYVRCSYCNTVLARRFQMSSRVFFYSLCSGEIQLFTCMRKLETMALEVRGGMSPCRRIFQADKRKPPPEFEHSSFPCSIMRAAFDAYSISPLPFPLPKLGDLLWPKNAPVSIDGLSEKEFFPQDGSVKRLLDHTPILNGNRPLPWLQVGVPCKRVMDTVTVKCGHCSHLSFLSPRAMVQSLTPPDHRMGLQGPCSDCLRGQPSPPSSSSSNSSEQMIQKPRFVMKPPEKKHRMPSAYNRFMKEEIQRIKAAKPDIPHREAFSMASKNWAKCDPRCSTTISTSDNSSGKSQLP
ncbi:Drooping leaf [Musa troglodytarum]|uniref:Drooping leaf n=1 Tax=Musa troglodytarum TaxID=320322 RepID=A0A9E7EAD2_9LILI|nr:Drooping leaf [Musa troglodytarum]